MTMKKIRNLIAVFFIGLFFMSSYEPVFIWLFIGAMVLLSSDEESPKKGKSRKNIISQISQDAKKVGVQMPRKAHLRSLLIRTYQKYNHSCKSYPHLKDEYAEILSEMWLSLASHVDPDHWEATISKVCSGWPSQKEAQISSVEEKLRKADELTRQWNEARQEVQGGLGV